MSNVKTKQIPQQVIEILERAQYSGDELRILEPLDRKTYVACNEVLEAAGGKWNKKAKAHIFESDAYQLLDPVFVAGQIEIPRDEFEFYETPLELANDLVGKFCRRFPLAQVERILEPSAGHGSLVDALLKQPTPDQSDIMFTLIEKHQGRVQFLRRKYKEDGHNDHFHVIYGDSTEMYTHCIGVGFDRIIMNPPFSRQQDIDHVMGAMVRLKRDGHLMAIMSAGTTFRTNRKAVEFRDMVTGRDGTIEMLPDNAFKASGTSVRTCVVTF